MDEKFEALTLYRPYLPACPRVPGLDFVMKLRPRL